MLSKREYDLLKQFSSEFTAPPPDRQQEIDVLLKKGLLERDDGVVSPYTSPGAPALIYRYRNTPYCKLEIKDYRDARRKRVIGWVAHGLMTAAAVTSAVFTALMYAARL